MFRSTAVLVCAVGLLGASTAHGDSVSGDGSWWAPCEGYPYALCPYMRVIVSASSGPSGEDPSGGASVWTVGPVTGGYVTGLSVAGNTAVILTEEPYLEMDMEIVIQDRTGIGELDLMFVYFYPWDGSWSGTFGWHLANEGDFVVIDVLTPAQQVDAQAPCSGPAFARLAWKNHGEYMQAVADAVNSLIEDGQITPEEAEALVSERAESGCGAR